MQPHVPGKLQGLAQAFLQYVRARVDLLQHEWKEEQARVLGKLARTGIFALGSLITLQLVCAFVLIAFWDTPWRLHAAGGLVLLFAGGTWLAWRGMNSGSDDDGRAFSSTLAEFDKDREIFERLAELRDPPEPARKYSAAPPRAGAVAVKPVPAPKLHADAGRPPRPAATAPSSPPPAMPRSADVAPTTTLRP